jgi:hypothetical protein
MIRRVDVIAAAVVVDGDVVKVRAMRISYQMRAPMNHNLRKRTKKIIQRCHTSPSPSPSCNGQKELLQVRSLMKMALSQLLRSAKARERTERPCP